MGEEVEVIDILSEITKYVLLPAIGFLAGFAAQWYLQERKARFELLSALATQRADALRDLWAITTLPPAITSLKDGVEVPSKFRKEADEKIIEWYTQNGGALFLSWQATHLVFRILDVLRQEGALRNQLETAVSALRTRLKFDCGIYSHREVKRQLERPQPPSRTTDVGRYLQSEKTQAFTSYLSTKNTQRLADLVTIQRPRSLRKSDDSDVIIWEALPSDIQETGYLAQPSRKKRIVRGDLRHARNQVLSKGDIVISIKGTVGLVGIVPDSAPHVSEDEFWTAGQSLLILTTRRSGVVETLYEYLTNDAVQSHLASLASGSTVPMLNINELKSLQVPILTEKEHLAVKNAFCVRQERFVSIDALRKQIAVERAKHWPHNELGDNSRH